MRSPWMSGCRRRRHSSRAARAGSVGTKSAMMIETTTEGPCERDVTIALSPPWEIASAALHHKEKARRASSDDGLAALVRCGAGLRLIQPDRPAEDRVARSRRLES